MCCICRRRLPKADLDRHVAMADGGDGMCREQGFLADTAQRLPGRGIYVCREKDCQERFLRRKVGRKKR